MGRPGAGLARGTTRPAEPVRRHARRRRAAVATIAWALGSVACADAPEDAALDLADRTATTPQAGRDWRAFVELAAGRATGGQSARSDTDDQRLSLDLRYDGRFAPGWRGVFADRLDAGWQGGFAHSQRVNTLQEAFASWSPRPDRIVDAGRVNVRMGVALGYNPTDWFRAGALRSVVSSDPDSLRSNRLGTVLLRGQALWPQGSVALLWSPRLAQRPNDRSFALDLGATNNRNRWLLSASRAGLSSSAPQWLLFGQSGQPPQLGVDATCLLGTQSLLFFEGAGGVSPSLLAQATGQGGRAMHARMASGLTWTGAWKQSLSAELEFNGAALNDAAWRGLARSSPRTFAAYLGTAGTLQDPPTRRRLFGRAAWQDAGIVHLDLAANAFHDLVDHSRQLWLEARYHWPRVDAALQWQTDVGKPGSDFGSQPAARSWQALATLYF